MQEEEKVRLRESRLLWPRGGGEFTQPILHLLNVCRLADSKDYRVYYRFVYEQEKITSRLLVWFELQFRRWEHPGRLGVNNIIDTPPPCLLDFTDKPGYSQMHVWVSDYIVFC